MAPSLFACTLNVVGSTLKKLMNTERNFVSLVLISCACGPMYWKPDLFTHLQFSGRTYLLLDGVDNSYSESHWNAEPF